ncbi:hypothetical protein ABZ876_32325 [Streptomyces sp. NPDC046931]|uniref:hypothetical protein n=1 Tax=Streptomyces sp. NPDC046931 TaxID=3154806 RepID=UPI00340042B1
MNVCKRLALAAATVTLAAGLVSTAPTPVERSPHASQATTQRSDLARSHHGVEGTGADPGSRCC